jgi:chromosome segregation ATPase
MKDKGSSDDRGNNYEVLYKKEKEINEFTEKFEHDKEQYEREISESQVLIAKLLEHMQKSLARQNKLPTQQQVTEMKDDLKFKQELLENSETTAARLKVQHEQIKQDLDKVKNLEGRIKKEMEQAEFKIDSMNGDINHKFQNTDSLKQQFEQEKHRMSKIKKFLTTYKVGLAK